MLAYTALLGTALVFWIVLTNNQWKQQAIKHGAAHYDAKSGEFKWNSAEASPGEQ